MTDLDRSKRFYCELLGFTLDREINPPDEMSAQLMSLTPPLGMTAAYLVRDGLVLELLHFAAAGQTQPYRARTMNEPGLTHISLSVDDIDAVLARVPEFGGKVVAPTPTSAGACSSGTPTASSSSSCRWRTGGTSRARASAKRRRSRARPSPRRRTPFRRRTPGSCPRAAGPG